MPAKNASASMVATKRLTLFVIILVVVVVVVVITAPAV
jgi:hypothetical protein